jgi:hypothetical protein
VQQFTAQWDMNYVIPLVVLGIVGVIAVLVGALALFKTATDTSRYHSDAWPMTALVSAVVVVLVAIIGGWVAFPLSGQYHRFVPKTGTVAVVGSRLVSSGSGNSATMQQKYVVTFTDGESYGVLDTRAANVAKGDKLTVMCERVFQWNAPNEGWDCNWGQDVKPNGIVIP